MNELYSADYDLRVGEILIAHEYTLQSGDIRAAYAQRRGFSGFVLVLDGTCDFHVNGMTYHVEKNQLIYFPAECAYVAEIPPRGGGFRHYTVNFVLTEIIGHRALAEMLRAEKPYVTDLSSHATFHESLPQLIESWNNKAPGYRLKCRHLLLGLLHDFISRYLAGQINPDLLARVMPAKIMIDEHYDEDLSISAMASACELSETHFRRCFFSAFGMSPIAYRTKLRIERAKDLLVASWYSIGEISAMTGFADISFFSRFFARHTGMSPTTYRREYGDRAVQPE